VSQVEKSIARLKARPSEANFEDVRRVLEGRGWQQARQEGSHVTFRKPGERSITVPLKDSTRVKRSYVDQICERLGLDA